MMPTIIPLAPMRLILMPKVMEITEDVHKRFLQDPRDLNISAHAYTEWLDSSYVPEGHLDWDFGISHGFLWVKYVACPYSCCEKV